jgi:hypothetical protein
MLGNPASPWDGLRRGDTDDVPGQCYAVLNDATFMLVDRAIRARQNRVTVHATSPMPYQEGSTYRRWHHHATVEQIPDADLDIFEQLYGLHALIGDPRWAPRLTPGRDQR